MGRAADHAGFRSVMAAFATGVTVVTAVGADGPAGMTANAVASLSLDPMLVMVGFDLRSRTLAAVRRSRRFAVNVLASDQEDVSRVFAGKQPEAEKFARCAHSLQSGVPILHRTLAWVRCDVAAGLTSLNVVRPRAARCGRSTLTPPRPRRSLAAAGESRTTGP